VKTPADVSRQIRLAAQAVGHTVRRVFLADGDALILPAERLAALLDELYGAFPRLQRVSAYAGPQSILRKDVSELAFLYEKGLKLVYYGLETGDGDLLKAINKGVTAEQAIEAGRRVRAAGLKLSMMVIVGLGGAPGSAAHARETARAVNLIRPSMLSALTLMLYRGSELRDDYEKGLFLPLPPPDLMAELASMLAAIDLPKDRPALFRSNHISNYISLAGTLPQDKDALIEKALAARRVLAEQDSYDPYNNVEIF
jgi:radical SAM superfamily enzyme YgiQ (UPF0313 family)